MQSAISYLIDCHKLKLDSRTIDPQQWRNLHLRPVGRPRTIAAIRFQIIRFIVFYEYLN